MLTKSFKFTVVVIVLIIIITAIYIFTIRRPVKIVGSQAPPEAAQTQSIADSQPKTFTHPSLGFSFQYPGSDTIGQFDDDNGETVLVQSSNATAVQIYAQSFGEPGPITAARIKKDLPNQQVNNAQNLSVGGETALVFDSQEDGIGLTKEAWFVHAGQLYRLTAPQPSADVFQTLLTSWNFDQ